MRYTWLIYRMQFENGAVIEPSCSPNGLIWLSSVQHQSAGRLTPAITPPPPHRERLQSLKPATRLRTQPSRLPPLLLLLLLLWRRKHVQLRPSHIYLSRCTSPGYAPVRLSFHPALLSNVDGLTSSRADERSISCQLRSRAERGPCQLWRREWNTRARRQRYRDGLHSITYRLSASVTPKPANWSRRNNRVIAIPPPETAGLL